MRYDPLVVELVAPAERGALGLLVELLLGLLRPGEEEPAAVPVQHAVARGAGVDVAAGLDRPEEVPPEQVLLAPALRVELREQGAHQLRVHPGELAEVVRVVLLPLLRRRALALRRALRVRGRRRDDGHSHVPVREPPALHPEEDVGVQRAAVLRLRPVEVVLRDPERGRVVQAQEVVLDRPGAPLEALHRGDRVLVHLRARDMGLPPALQVLVPLLLGRRRAGASPDVRQELRAPVVLRDGDHAAHQAELVVLRDGVELLPPPAPPAPALRDVGGVRVAEDVRGGLLRLRCVLA